MIVDYYYSKLVNKFSPVRDFSGRSYIQKRFDPHTPWAPVIDHTAAG